MIRKPTEVELHPDAWGRFERTVKVAAKSPPQYRTKADKGPDSVRGDVNPTAKAKCTEGS